MSSKNITICAENNVDVNLDKLITYLNEKCKSIKFNSLKFTITIDDEVITSPKTSPKSYTNLDKKILEQCKNDFQTLIFTLKRYENNFFWDPYKQYNIISLYNWNSLTKLSMNNGVAYFIAAIVSQDIDIRVRHNETTGCIYDFNWHKPDIDKVMRIGFICPSCLKRIKTKQIEEEKEALLTDLENILNDLSTASKWDKDIIDYWTKKKSSQYFEDIEIKGIERAIELALSCKPEDERPHPKVGAVIIKNNLIVCESYRGEKNPGDHAEYTALIKKSGGIDLRGATLIATLEPCTTRKPDKKPCCQHIVEKGIKKVIIGMLDPNPEIRGKGEIFLQQKEKLIVDRFPYEYASKIVAINKDFIDSQFKKYSTDLMKEGSSKEPPVLTKSMNFESFKEIFEYAKSYNGLRLSHDEAREFSIKWREQFFEKDFNSFKEMFEYAKSYNGMRLSHVEAREFAIKLMEQS